MLVWGTADSSGLVPYLGLEISLGPLSLLLGRLQLCPDSFDLLLEFGRPLALSRAAVLALAQFGVERFDLGARVLGRLFVIRGAGA